jgi:phosphatidate cytidylyltransferase
MHFKRLIVAAALLPLIYLYIMYLSSEYFTFLLILVSVIAIWEFYSMYHIEGIIRFIGLISGISILVISYISKGLLADIIIFSFIVMASVRLFLKKTPRSSLYDISPPVLGLLYIPCLLTYQTRLREFGPEWVIILYAMVWTADTFAFYIGTLIGKRKLYVEISPKKTLAGAAGSLIGGAFAAVFLKTVLIPALTMPTALAVGITIGIISIVGDLVESMFKRDSGVKDSGVIIPGHGGILDKIDGVLFAGPVLYLILIIKGN